MARPDSKAARVFVKLARPDSTLVQPKPARPGPERYFQLQRFFPSKIRRSLRYNYQYAWEQLISVITNMM
jgi:hypothetical protein